MPLQMSCFNCGNSVKLVAEKIMHADTCPRGQADLHCCRNCRLFDPAAHNECREPIAEWQRTKNKRNYCNYFEPKETVDLTRKPADKMSGNKARKKWGQLFRK